MQGVAIRKQKSTQLYLHWDSGWFSPQSLLHLLYHLLHLNVGCRVIGCCTFVGDTILIAELLKQV